MSKLRRQLKQQARIIADNNPNLEVIRDHLNQNTGWNNWPLHFRSEDSYNLRNLLRDENHYDYAALQFLDMKKDFLDTFKRYKPHQVQRDLGQFFTGLVNMFKAILYLGVSTFSTICTLPVFILDPMTGIEFLNCAIGALAHSLALALRGLTQMLTAPLTLARVLFRGIATMIGGWKPLYQGEGVVELVNQGDNIAAIHNNNRVSTIIPMVSIVEALYKKVQRRGFDGPLSYSIDRARNDFYSGLATQVLDGNGRQAVSMQPEVRIAAQNYLRLFRPGIIVEAEPHLVLNNPPAYQQQ